MKLIANIVLLSILLGCSNQYAPINSTSKSNHNEKLQEKTEAELEKESSVYPPIKDFPFEVKVVPVLYIDEEQTELTRDKSYNPKTSIGGAYNILVTNKINHDIQVLGTEVTALPRIASKILVIEDFNGDGYLDIMAANLPIAQSGYLASTIYVYKPEFKNFSESEGIIQQGTIDTPKPGCISVEYPHPNNFETITDFYCWKNGKWKPVNLKQP